MKGDLYVCIIRIWLGQPKSTLADIKVRRRTRGSCAMVVETRNTLLRSLMVGSTDLNFVSRCSSLKKPTSEQLEALGCLSKTNIIQTYLKSDDNKTERRVRQRGTKQDGFNFYYTEKVDIGAGERLEQENKITPSEYISYLAEADTSLHQISKIRRCFIYSPILIWICSCGQVFFYTRKAG